jgi:hypothetical protein
MKYPSFLRPSCIFNTFTLLPLPTTNGTLPHSILFFFSFFATDIQLMDLFRFTQKFSDSLRQRVKKVSDVLPGEFGERLRERGLSIVKKLKILNSAGGEFPTQSRFSQY